MLEQPLQRGLGFHQGFGGGGREAQVPQQRDELQQHVFALALHSSGASEVRGGKEGVGGGGAAPPSAS